MARKMKAPRAKKTTPAPSRAQQVLRDTWTSTLEALTAAEAQVEKQVKALLKKNKINVDDAAEMIKEFRARVEKERKKGVKGLEARLKDVQARVRKQRTNVAKRAELAVQSGLAALNIPSRREIAELTRKVDELSKKIDTLRKKKK